MIYLYRRERRICNKLIEKQENIAVTKSAADLFYFSFGGALWPCSLVSWQVSENQQAINSSIFC